MKKTKKKKLSVAQRKANALKRNQRRMIVDMLANMGFDHIAGIDGKHFEFKDRKTEMDDIFIYRNLIVLVEYTTTDKPGEHLLNKDYFYRRVNEDKKAFIELMLKDEQFSSFQSYYKQNLERDYSNQELLIRILYCSKTDVSEEHNKVVNPKLENENVVIFDDRLVRYFSLNARSIKKTSRYEFFDYLNIPFDKIGLANANSTTTYSGYLLPEEKSRFSNGFKVLTFYIDAETLLQRSNVFRQNSWRDVNKGTSYQRMVGPKKVNLMREYLFTEQRVFVNNIIGSISIDDLELKYNNKYLDFDENGMIVNHRITEAVPVSIVIKDKCNIIRLIDGQHRTYSYYEGTDKYEETIARQRKKQNLLLTIIVFPRRVNEIERTRFEARLFMEINTKQTNVEPNLTQEITCLLDPFSTTAISKKVLSQLGLKNHSLVNRVLLNPLDTNKDLLKTASIVSYGISPLIRIDTEKNDSIFSIWDYEHKDNLLSGEDYTALQKYIDFCANTIDELLSAIKILLPLEAWTVSSKKNDKGKLSVTFINGIMNLLRLLIENKETLGRDYYLIHLKDIASFDTKAYKSSQYRAMGQDIYTTFFGKE